MSISLSSSYLELLSFLEFSDFSGYCFPVNCDVWGVCFVCDAHFLLLSFTVVTVSLHDKPSALLLESVTS